MNGKPWTKKDDAYMRRHFPHKRTADIAKKLGRSYHATSQRAQLLGLQKTEAFMYSWAWNPRPAPRTAFKKGQKPHNLKGDGVISLHKVKDTACWHIRIDGKWQRYNRYLWQQANGPIPKGGIVAFIDGNPQNCVLENLELITTGELAKRNSASLNLTNGFVLRAITGKHNIDQELDSVLLKNTDLIEAKRQQILLNRQLKTQLKPQTI